MVSRTFTFFLASHLPSWAIPQWDNNGRILQRPLILDRGSVMKYASDVETFPSRSYRRFVRAHKFSLSHIKVMIAVCRRVSIPNCEQVIQFVVITREIVALFDLMCWNFFHPLSLDNDKRINDIQSNWLFNMSRGGSSMDESHNGGNLTTIEQRFVTQHSLECPTFFFFSVWPIESENGHGSKQSTPTARYRKKAKQPYITPLFCFRLVSTLPNLIIMTLPEKRWK